MGFKLYYREGNLLIKNYFFSLKNIVYILDLDVRLYGLETENHRRLTDFASKNDIQLKNIYIYKVCQLNIEKCKAESYQDLDTIPTN